MRTAHGVSDAGSGSWLPNTRGVDRGRNFSFSVTAGPRDREKSAPRSGSRYSDSLAASTASSALR
jgi:hypothetical protein